MGRSAITSLSSRKVRLTELSGGNPALQALERHARRRPATTTGRVYRADRGNEEGIDERRVVGMGNANSLGRRER